MVPVDREFNCPRNLHTAGGGELTGTTLDGVMLLVSLGVEQPVFESGCRRFGPALHLCRIHWLMR